MHHLLHFYPWPGPYKYIWFWPTLCIWYDSEWLICQRASILFFYSQRSPSAAAFSTFHKWYVTPFDKWHDKHGHTVTQSHSHTVTQSHSHKVTQFDKWYDKHSHTVTQPHSHTVTQFDKWHEKHSHTVIQSHSHTVTQPHSHTVMQSHSHTVTQSHSHTVTQSHSHTVTQSHSLINDTTTNGSSAEEHLYCIPIPSTHLLLYLFGLLPQCSYEQRVAPQGSNRWRQVTSWHERLQQSTHSIKGILSEYVSFYLSEHGWWRVDWRA